jgi:hypothetical protein
LLFICFFLCFFFPSSFIVDHIRFYHFWPNITFLIH